ncbi:MAG: ribonucleotide-diphosphate reductase subunit beta [Candidatus Ureaplasma intestinipullorum]|uniref:ribonucleoside-diphosphate reductase n=1 Tax=Candidatus Ureaplasma intestinipullorum TaxID=2838770 RepID=A0A9E2KX13_9BACT|nr:ribonucleotide-diphosphate reductase subunit beta [Candidatus Ureaplasma intestinipullorum]
MKKLIDLDLIQKPKDIKIFLGKYNGFQRYDIIKYPFAKQIEANMRQAFWTPEEISLISDRENFKDLPEHAQQVIISNLLFQTLMDSAQNRGLDSIMSELVTSSEWEAVFKTQAFFELIHSLSYSHIIREMFSSDATTIFDKIYMIDEIKHRTDKEINEYSLLKEYINGNHPEWSEEETKKHILTLLVRIYFLEGLKFYISFMVTYMINYSYNDAISGIAKIIKLINFDEDMHVAVVGGLIRILMREEAEGFSELFKSAWFKTKVNEIVTSIVEDELKWAEYLLSFGPIPSLTIDVFTNFMHYYANDRMIKINLEPIFKNVSKPEIVTWFDMYKDINKDNTAQQESTALNYNIGNMSMDYNDNDLEKMLKELLDRNAK